LKAGYIVTKREKRARPSQRKGKLGRRVALIREVIRDIAGYAPYERRIMELLKGGGNNPQKRAAKFAKARLGTHIRAKRKVGEMATAISKQQQQARKPAVTSKGTKKTATTTKKPVSKAKPAAAKPAADKNKKEKPAADKEKAAK